MKNKYQVTIYNAEGKYKPISTIVDVEEGTEKKSIISAGVTKICVKKYWNKADLQKWGYTKAKCRPYSEEN